MLLSRVEEEEEEEEEDDADDCVILKCHPQCLSLAGLRSFLTLVVSPFIFYFNHHTPHRPQ